MARPQLRQALFGGRDLFVRALTEKLMMYAVGRELEYYDMPQVRAVVRRAAAQDYRLSAIVSGIVTSDAFRMQARLRRARLAACTAQVGAQEGLTMFLTKKTPVPADRAARRRCHAGPAAARCHDPGRDRAGADGRRAEDAHGILLHPARRDHGQHLARPGDGPVDAERLGRRLQAESDPEVARAAQALCHLVRKPPEPGDGGWRAQPGAGHLAERHAAGPGSAGASMSATLDQVVAQHIGQNTTLPSLELASETTQQAAACSGSACFYNTTLSFRDAHSPLPMEYNPRKVFAQLFGEGDTPEERAAISNQTKSLLDRITRPHARVAAGSGCGRSGGARQLPGDGA